MESYINENPKDPNSQSSSRRLSGEFLQATVTPNTSNKPSEQRYYKEGQLFVCADCGVRYKFRSQMETHQRVHTGVKPFVCNVCFKGFAQKNNLKSHMVTHMDIGKLWFDSYFVLRIKWPKFTQANVLGPLTRFMC